MWHVRAATLLLATACVPAGGGEPRSLWAVGELGDGRIFSAEDVPPYGSIDFLYAYELGASGGFTGFQVFRPALATQQRCAYVRPDHPGPCADGADGLSLVAAERCESNAPFEGLPDLPALDWSESNPSQRFALLAGCAVPKNAPR